MAEREIKICGQHACRAVFERRPDDILRVFLTEPLVQPFGDQLRACAQARRPYRVVADAELERIAASRHHEGICVVARPRPKQQLATLLRAPGPAVVLALEGIGNPHNLGALLRTGAHFGVRAALVAGSARRLSAAAHRTAEGAAEWLDITFPDDLQRALDTCRKHGFTVCATSSHKGQQLFQQPLPERAVVLLGAERTGLSAPSLKRADRLLRIPGTGHVESLNVSVASAVILAELWRQHRTRT